MVPVGSFPCVGHPPLLYARILTVADCPPVGRRRQAGALLGGPSEARAPALPSGGAPATGRRPTGRACGNTGSGKPPGAHRHRQRTRASRWASEGLRRHELHQTPLATNLDDVGGHGDSAERAQFEAIGRRRMPTYNTTRNSSCYCYSGAAPGQQQHQQQQPSTTTTIFLAFCVCFC